MGELPDTVVEELRREGLNEAVPSPTNVRRPSTLGNGKAVLFLFQKNYVLKL